MFFFCSMTNAATTTGHHAPILAELAEMGLSLARAVHEKALAAETQADLAEMTLAFHRISRSLRQTLALEAKLERDRTRQAQAAEIGTIRTCPQRATERKAQLRTALEPIIWDEAEGEEAEVLLDVLDELLAEESLSDDFLAGSIEAHVERIRQDLGLAAAPAGVVAKDAAPAESGWRSSA
jgi:lambda repressor-like predicted transcriptional regulator